MSRHDDRLRAKLKASRRVRARSHFSEYMGRPCEFAVEVLGLTMWRGLEEILTSLRDNVLTYVCGGHKLSKSTSNVAGALWWCGAEHPGNDGRWAAVCPSGDQIKRVFWNELTIQLERIAEERPRVRDMLGPELGLDPRTGWRMSGGAQIIGVATDKVEKVAGISAPWLVVNIDEATGYPDELYNGWEGNMAGGAKGLFSSNPTVPEGWFFDGMTSGEGTVLRYSAYDSPNVIANEKVIPGLAENEWVERLERKHGPNPELNPEFQIRVLGQFPERGENQIISMGDLRRAQDGWHPDMEPERGQLTIGVDPARYGVDECVIQPVRGQFAYEPTILSGAVDGKEIADAVIEALRLHRRERERRVPIVVDGVSSGSTAVDMLEYSEARRRGELVVHVHEGFRDAEDDSRFGNRRTEVWDALNDWLKAGAFVPKGAAIRKEMAKAMYKFDSRSRKVMESKERMKAKLKRSPNRADALTLAISSPPPPSDGGFDTDIEEPRGDARWL